MEDTKKKSGSTQQIEQITNKLEEGVKALFESETYINYLKVMAKFHNYSFNNSLLIAMQMPTASLVAGYTSWKANFHRNVNKGEKGIKIIAPSPYKIDKIQDKIDPVTNNPVFDADGNIVKEKVKVIIPAYKVTTVFDISQTSGEEIPTLTHELDGDVDEYNRFIESVKLSATVPIEFERIKGMAKGFYEIENKRIVVNEGMSQMQTAKTMIHELAHSILHDKDDGSEKEADRKTKEVQAESVAYTVCQHFGIDTSDYSFGYIGGWSSGKGIEELKNSMQIIRKTSSDLINDIEKNMDILKEKDKDYSITYFATSNTTFPHENNYIETDSIDEAIECYKKLSSDYASGIPGIGFVFQTKDKDDIYNDSEMLLLSGNKLCSDVVAHVDRFNELKEIQASLKKIQNKIPHLINPLDEKEKIHSKVKGR